MQSQTKIAETSLGRVEYSDAGEGEPLLYFHGTGITGDAMVPIESQLMEDGFRLVIPNRPGYGGTPLASHTTAVDCSNIASALLDSLGLQTVSVMGSSGGGAFALSFALNHPNRTRSLVLLCPQLHRWDAKKWLPETSKWTLPFLKQPMLRKLLLKAYRFQFARMTAKQFLKMEAGRRFSSVADDPKAIQICEAAIAAMQTGSQFPGFENDMRVFLSENIIEDASNMNSPTMVIHDTWDPLAPVAHIDWFTSLVPNCRRLNVETAGHLIWVGPDSELMHNSRVQFLNEQVVASMED